MTDSSPGDPVLASDYLSLGTRGYAQTPYYWGRVPSIFLVSIPPAPANGTAAERRALDIGCGQGRNTGALLEKGYHVDAVDILPAAVLATRARYGAKVRVSQDDYASYLRRTPPEYYRVVLANHIIQHLADTDELHTFIALCKKVLTSTGHLALAYFTEPADLHPEVVRKHALLVPRGYIYRHFFEGQGYLMKFYQYDVMTDTHDAPHAHPVERLIVEKVPE